MFSSFLLELEGHVWEETNWPPSASLQKMRKSHLWCLQYKEISSSSLGTRVLCQGLWWLLSFFNGCWVSYSLTSLLPFYWHSFYWLFSRVPQATFFDAKHSVSHLDFDESKNHLLTSGCDRVIKVSITLDLSSYDWLICNSCFHFPFLFLSHRFGMLLIFYKIDRVKKSYLISSFFLTLSFKRKEIHHLHS